MEGDSLRSAIDIYALQITVALDDSLACGIVGITAGLAVIPTIPSVGYPHPNTFSARCSNCQLLVIKVYML